MSTRPTGSRSQSRGGIRLIEDLITALRAVGIPITKYAWDIRPDTDNIIVSHSSVTSSVYGDDRMIEQAPHGYIDLFSVTDKKDYAMQIQQILNGLEGIAWRLNVVDYEESTRLMHWQWEFSCVEW